MAAAFDRVEPPREDVGVPWVQMTLGTDFPPNLVCAGTCRGMIVFVGRAYHNGELLVGPVMNNRCTVAKDGKVYEYMEYELLTNNTDYLVWERSAAEIHPNAVLSGKLNDGTTLLTGKHEEDGNAYVGWVHRGFCTLFVPQDGTERIYVSYHVLINRSLNEVKIFSAFNK